MSSQIRRIIIAACVITVLSVTLALLVRFLPKVKTGGSSSSSNSSISVASMDKSKVQSVHITNKEGEYTFIKTTQDNTDKWNIDVLKNIPLSEADVSSVVSEAANVTATKLIEESPSDLDQYGLKNPQATVKVNGSDNESYTIKIGNTVPVEGGYYMQKEGDSAVYVLSSTSGSNFTRNANYFIDRTLTTVDSTKLNSLTKIVLAGKERPNPIVLEIDPKSSSSSSSESGYVDTSAPVYNIVSPVKYYSNPENVSTLVNGLVALNASNVISLDVSDKYLENYGLKDPLYTISFTYQGQETTLMFGKFYIQNGTYYVYVMVKGRNVVYSVDVQSILFYNWQLMNVAPKTLQMIMINDVKVCTVSAGSQTWKFYLEHNDSTDINKNLKVTYASKNIDVPSFRNYWMHLMNFNIAGAAEKPQNAEKLLTITYEYVDSSKSPDVFEFYKIDDYRAFYSINGTGWFYVRSSQVDNVINLTNDLVKGKSISPPQ